MDYARKIAFYDNGPQLRTKLRQITLIDRFGDNNQVNSKHFNATILKFSEKYDHQYLYVFIFNNMFPESHGFVAICRLEYQRFVNVLFYQLKFIPILLMKDTKLFDLVTGNETGLSGIM